MSITLKFTYSILINGIPQRFLFKSSRKIIYIYGEGGNCEGRKAFLFNKYHRFGDSALRNWFGEQKKVIISEN